MTSLLFREQLNWERRQVSLSSSIFPNQLVQWIARLFSLVDERLHTDRLARLSPIGTPTLMSRTQWPMVQEFVTGPGRVGMLCRTVIATLGTRYGLSRSAGWRSLIGQVYISGEAPPVRTYEPRHRGTMYSIVELVSQPLRSKNIASLARCPQLVDDFIREWPKGGSVFIFTWGDNVLRPT